MVMDNQDPIERGLYAVAAALEKISGSIDELSHAVHRLGNADAATPMGGLEALGKSDPGECDG